MTKAYDRWQSVLATEFLAPHVGPTLFFVDDSILSHLDPDSQSASDELARSVHARINPLVGKSMFDSIMAEFKRWERGLQEEAPPILPVIAVTVLAATRMRSAGSVRSTNYYLRLAETLLPGADDGAIETLRKNLGEKGGFLDVVDLWRGLHTWIEDQGGAVGISTIRQHHHFQRIGYPLSQALVRQHDQVLLTRFFSDLDFTAGQPPSSATLFNALLIWTTADRNRLSDTFMRGLHDSEIRPLLTDVIEAHARAWDGRVLTSPGKLRIAIRVSIDLEAWTTGILFCVPPEGPQTLSLSQPNSETTYTLIASAGYDYYAVQPEPPVSPDSLLAGFRLSGGAYVAELPPSPVILFSPDPQTGAWSSTDGIKPFEDHLAAVHSKYAEDFERALRDAADENWRRIPQRRFKLLPGFTLFEDIRFTNGDKLSEALSRLPALRRVGVTPALVPRARLVRGLPLATTISRTHYLVGGEPDLLLPTGGQQSQFATVTLNGLTERLPANGFPIELRRFIDEAGKHQVEVDGQTLTFTTLQDGPDPAPPAGTASLGWTDTLQLTHRGADTVLNGAVPKYAPEFRTVLGRRGRDESCILYASGEIEHISDPSAPLFLSTLNTTLHSPYFEMNVSANARWFAQRRGSKWRLTEIGSERPREYQLEFDVLAAWERACVDENAYRLWNHQLRLTTETA